MAEELEIKLTVKPCHFETALSWLTVQPQAERQGSKILVNCYYDTPRAELNRQRAALRVRQAGGRCIQTLKTQGEFVSGAHRREEWEWPVVGAALEWNLLAETPLANSIRLDQLVPVFETNFTRQIVMIDDGEAVIECALDTGWILADGKREPLHEVEFELKSGSPARLLVWAERLAQQCPVFLNLNSKAEQGYFLAGIHAPEATQPAANVDNLDRLLMQLGHSWLTGQRPSVEGLNLSCLRDQAKACGLEQAFTELIERLANGDTLNSLLDKPGLGLCQLGLLAHREMLLNRT